MAVVGFTETFEISPSIVNQDAQFVISVKNNKRLDYEQVRQLNFKVSPFSYDFFIALGPFLVACTIYFFKSGSKLVRLFAKNH